MRLQQNWSKKDHFNPVQFDNECTNRTVHRFEKSKMGNAPNKDFYERLYGNKLLI
jgi:hypothetical protein